MDTGVPESIKYQVALVMGKFMPPHLGHDYLIKEALSRSHETIILLVSRDTDPIPGHLRMGWLLDLYPGANIVELALQRQLEPKTVDPIEQWAVNIKIFLPVQPTVIFSSESYGQQLAQMLGIQHVLIDLARKQFPVSSTAIRSEPAAHWAYLPDCVKKYYSSLGIVVKNE